MLCFELKSIEETLPILCLQFQKIFATCRYCFFSPKQENTECLLVVPRISSSVPAPGIAPTPFYPRFTSLLRAIHFGIFSLHQTYLILSETKSLLLNSKYEKLICSQYSVSANKVTLASLCFKNGKGRISASPFYWKLCRRRGN